MLHQASPEQAKRPDLSLVHGSPGSAGFACETTANTPTNAIWTKVARETIERRRNKFERPLFGISLNFQRFQGLKSDQGSKNVVSLYDIIRGYRILLVQAEISSLIKLSFPIGGQSYPIQQSMQELILQF